MDDRDRISKESEPGNPLPEEQNPKAGLLRLIGSTVLFVVLVLIVVSAVFNYDFGSHSTARFVIFEIVFIGLTVKCFFWMRDCYRQR